MPTDWIKQLAAGSFTPITPDTSTTPAPQPAPAPTPAPSDDLNAMDQMKPSVTESLGAGLPDKLLQILGVNDQERARLAQLREAAGRQSAARTAQSMKGPYGDVVAGTSTGLNAFTMGGANAAEKLVDPQNYQNLRQLEAEHPTGSTIGTIAGTGASMAIPGLGELAGVGDVAKGGAAAAKFLPQLAKAGLNSAGYAIPNAISQGIQTGDWGEAAKQAAINTGLGTAVGTPLGMFAGKIGNKLAALKKEGEKARIALTGIGTRDMRRVAGDFFHGSAQKVQDWLGEFSKYLGKEGIDNQEALENAVSDQAPMWSAVKDSWNGRGTDLPSISGKLTDPTATGNEALVGQLGQGVGTSTTKSTNQQAYDAIMRDMDGITDYNEIKDKLSGFIEQGQAPGPGRTMRAQAQVASALKTAFDSHIADTDPAVLQQIQQLSGGQINNLDDLKNLYKFMAPAKEAVMRNILKMPTKNVGAKAFSRALPTTALAGALGGAALGGGGSYLLGQPDDPDRMNKALIKAGLGAMAGGVGGGIINSALSNVAGRVTGGLMGSIAERLSPSVIEGIEKVAPGIAALPSKAIGNNLLQALQTNQKLPADPDEPQLGPPPAEGSPAAGVATSVPDKATSAQAQATEAAHQAAPLPVQEQAKTQTNQVWSDKILQKLNNLYDTQLYQYGYSREQVLDAFKAATDNWDPVESAAIIFPDKSERDAYLKTYELSLKLNSGVTNTAFSNQKAGLLAGIGLGHNPDEVTAAQSQLNDLLTGAFSQPGQMPDASKIKIITNTINQIASQKIPISQKKKLLQQKLQSWGLNFDQLQQLGFGGLQ